MCNSTQKKLCSDEECDICLNRSFATSNRAQYWSIELNNGIKPRDVFRATSKKFWFNCGNHVFQSDPNHITSSNRWCPYPCCSINSDKLCTLADCNVCYNASFASSDKAQFWHQELNLNENNELIKPRDVFLSSNNKYWFNCGSHIFESALNNVTAGYWCPFACCCKITTKLCDDNYCDVCYDASFASEDKADFWSDKNKINPRDVPKSTDKKFWFDCGSHEFESSLSHITIGSWCPYPCCSQGFKKLCNEEHCKICYNASFASSDKAQYWSYELNNGVKPRDITKSVGDKYWFKCPNSNHLFEKLLSEITRTDEKSFCPYPCCCNFSKKLCNEECTICTNASFASSDKAQFWFQDLNINEDNELILPRDVCKSGKEKYWFKCENKHIFDATLGNITNGRWCPKCSTHGYSKKAIKWLTNIINTENIFIQHAENIGEYIIKSDIFKSSVDGYCKETNTVYEFHGDFWHGNPNKYNAEDINSITKTSFGELYTKTLQREQKIRDLGYNLVVIWESDYKN